MYFNYLNAALLSTWCHVRAIWMLIMIKRVFWSYRSAEKSIKSFSKGPFLRLFLYFFILLQIIHRMQNINNFPVFDIGSLIKTYTTYFCTSTFAKLVLLINFYFLGMLLHYPIFLLPLDKCITNNKQT